MAINLLDLVKGYLTPDVVEKAASFVGESPSATQSALSGGVPAIIGALSEMASTRAGADQIGRMLDAGKFDGSALTNPERILLDVFMTAPAASSTAPHSATPASPTERTNTRSGC